MIEIQTLRASDAAFALCMEIREEVFVAEQSVPQELERDEYDDTALHFLAFLEGEAVATARVLLKDDGRTAKIGRVAVRKVYRCKGLGKDLLTAIEQDHTLSGVHRFVLDAQIQALPFYETLGYAAEGPEFLDAGIPHRHMRKLNGIQIVANPTSEIRAAIAKPLIHFNEAALGKPSDYKLLVLTVTEPETDDIIGGLWGHTIHSHLYVDLLVVPETRRRQGIGERLLATAESEARKRGCVGAWLSTYSFQARGFYERQGYNVFAVMDGFPPEHSCIFLRKVFGDATEAPPVS
jgi:predicted GNAT family N-acyltransferase